ncbi:hypothetical protein F5Y13DRAFT_176086, partial [Hypoxylon sp. FL1857]
MQPRRASTRSLPHLAPPLRTPSLCSPVASMVHVPDVAAASICALGTRPRQQGWYGSRFYWIPLKVAKGNGKIEQKCSNWVGLPRFPYHISRPFYELYGAQQRHRQPPRVNFDSNIGRKVGREGRRMDGARGSGRAIGHARAGGVESKARIPRPWI